MKMYVFVKRFVVGCLSLMVWVNQCWLFVSDLRGVINTSLRSTTAPCPRLVCASWRWRLTTPSTSTETCEYTPPRSDWPGAVTDAPPPLSLSLSQVFRGRGFLRVPVGSGSRIRRSHPHQESWRRLQEDQGMLGLHPRGGGAGETFKLMKTFDLWKNCVG